MHHFITSHARKLLPAILGLIVLPLASVVPNNAEASDLSTELQTLVDQGTALTSQLSAISITTTSYTPLSDAISAVKNYTSAVKTVNASLTSPIALETDNLIALEQLSIISSDIAFMLPKLSSEITAFSALINMPDMQTNLNTILQLSNEIDSMANRTLEMADKILIKAENIDDMTDRILLSQQVQSSNMVLTQSFILTTQENIVALFGSFNVIAYTLL